MGLKSKVIDGDYKGKYIVAGATTGIVISVGFTKQIKIDEETVEKYEVYDSNNRVSTTSAIGRGAVGSFFLGPVGLLAAASAKKIGTHAIFIQFKDGKRSLVELDDKAYRQFLLIPFKNSEDIKDNNISECDIPEQIKKLSELKDNGILTEEEFINKKTELLSRM